MTRIHHATIRRAEKEGVIMKMDEMTEIVTAHWTEGNARIEHPDAKEALDGVLLVKMLRSEYPAVILSFDTGTNEWTLQAHTENGPTDVFSSYEALPSLADILDAFAAADIDPEEGYEEVRASIVVPAHYKRKYAEGGHPNNCGDWLAQQLDGRFSVIVEGKPAFDPDAFTACLVDNGVELVGKWAALPTSGQNGWVGRYRMNGRQKLEQQVLRNGGLTLGGMFTSAPQGFLDYLAERHPKIAVALLDQEAA
jgi:hypothetical protein